MNQTRAKKPISPAELWFCGAMLGLVAMFFAAMGYLEEAPKFERLRRDGLTVNTEVLRKINFTTSCEPNRKGIARTCRTRELHVRFPEPNSITSSWRYGSVSVSETVYAASLVGQTVPVVYLLYGSTDLWLAADVQNFSMLWYNLLGAVGVFGLIFCSIKAVLSLRRTKKGKSYA